MPRALTPLPAAALWMSDHHGPLPSSPPPPWSRRLDGRRGIRRRLLGLGHEPADVGAHAGQRRATFAEAGADGRELALAGADELLRRALVGRELDRPVGELPLGGLDGPHDVPVAAGDGAHHGQLRDQIAQVGGAEDGVHGRHVVVLVHGDGPRDERGAGQAELLVREALQPLVLLELLAHRLEPARRARVPRDGGADLRVETGDLGRDGLGLVAVLLELRRSAPRPERPRAPGAAASAQSASSATERQTTYRVALFQCASSEAGGGRRSRGPPGRCQARRKGRVET